MLLVVVLSLARMMQVPIYTDIDRHKYIYRQRYRQI